MGWVTGCGPLHNEPFPSCVGWVLDVVQHEDGGHDRGGPAWAATQLCRDFPGLEGGVGAFADGADLGAGNGAVSLEVCNDGAHGAPGQGSGLAERAVAVSGWVGAETADDGRFCLRVWIPEEIM
jgi:hypothetical protein